MDPLSRRAFVSTGLVAGSAPFTGCLGGSEEYGTAWEEIDQIELIATASQWRGVEPTPIRDANNPTFRLVHGRTYSISWENGDGHEHVLEFRNHEDDVIEASESLDEVDARTTVEIQAVAGLTNYACPHFDATMGGDIEIF